MSRFLLELLAVLSDMKLEEHLGRKIRERKNRSVHQRQSLVRGTPSRNLTDSKRYLRWWNSIQEWIERRKSRFVRIQSRWLHQKCWDQLLSKRMSGKIQMNDQRGQFSGIYHILPVDQIEVIEWLISMLQLQAIIDLHWLDPWILWIDQYRDGQSPRCCSRIDQLHHEHMSSCNHCMGNPSSWNGQLMRDSVVWITFCRNQFREWELVWHFLYQNLVYNMLLRCCSFLRRLHNLSSFVECSLSLV